MASPLTHKFSIGVNSAKARRSRVGGLLQLDAPTMLLFAGMVILFFNQWLGYSIDLRGEEAGLGVFRYSLLASALILAGAFICLFESGGAIIWKQRRYRVWLGGYFGLLAIMVARSYLEGAGLLRVGWDTTFYLLVVVMFFGQKDSFWPRLTQLLVFQTLLAVVYGLLVLSSFVMPSSGLMRAAVYGSDVILLRSLLCEVPFLLFAYPILSRRARIITIVGALIYLVVAVLAQNRGTLVISLLTFVIAGFIWWRIEKSRAVSRRIILVLIIAFGIGLLTWNSHWARSLNLEHSWQLLVNRSTREGSILVSTLADYRFYEARIVAEWMTWDRWLIGSGVSGTWQHPAAFFGEERTMVHIGYLNLVFKGGVFLLLLFILFPLLRGWRALLNSRNIWTLAAAGIIVLYSINLLYGGYLRPNLGLVLLYLCAGRVAAERIRMSSSYKKVDSSESVPIIPKVF